jgi:DNA polymerase III epsilon subunit-like protein
MLKALRAVHGMDAEQAQAVFTKTHAKATAPKNPPTQAKWEAFLDKQIAALALDMNVDTNAFSTAAEAMHRAKAHAPDAHLWATLRDLDERMGKAVSATRRQINFAAAFRGVDPAVAAERYEAFRAQYRREFSRLPAVQRPTPPEAWVRGFTTKDMMAVSAPADAATLYALYRCQADPDAFDTSDARFASIDLETAGPEGKDGFEPANGSIIEVGIVEYDTHGNVLDRYETFVAPATEVAERCGTGAVAVHGITMADVAGAPDWNTIAPQVAERLRGRVMMAQNARFEHAWLDHHMSESGTDYDAYGATVDTVCVAKQHFPDWENHKLATICGNVGVAYTDGHRAMHDAEVAAQAYFAMRGQVYDQYRASSLSAIPTPAPVTVKARYEGLTRLSAGDYSPSTVADPWATTPLSTRITEDAA